MRAAPPVQMYAERGMVADACMAPAGAVQMDYMEDSAPEMEVATAEVRQWNQISSVGHHREMNLDLLENLCVLSHSSCSY